MLPTLRPQTASFGILDSVSNDSFFENSKVFINDILLYLSFTFIDREKREKFINVNDLIAGIQKVKKIEKIVI